MNDFQNESAKVNPSSLHMDTGADVLATWSETAGQAHRNAVYGTLFSMLDGTLLRTHQIIEDHARADEFYVPVKDDLVLKLRINDGNSFDVVHVGSWAEAPGFDFRLDQLS
jgi:hypothetical protein